MLFFFGSLMMFKKVWNKDVGRMLERFEFFKKLNLFGIVFDYFLRYFKVRII